MRLLLRRPFPEEDAREKEAGWPTTIFVTLVSGFVTWELLTEWPRANATFLAVPHGLASLLGAPALGGLLDGLWALDVVPLVAWTLAASALRLCGRSGSLGSIWRHLALPVAVVVSAGHMAKGLAKLVSWAPFLPQALRDPPRYTGASAGSSSLFPSSIDSEQSLTELASIAVSSSVRSTSKTFSTPPAPRRTGTPR
jgi:hypothetical protein